MERAIGCVEYDSALAANDSNSFLEISGTVNTFLTLKDPSVTVPVLSSAATLAVERLSILVPPLKRMPSLEAAPIHEKKESGMDITIAHGQLITRNVRAV